MCFLPAPLVTRERETHTLPLCARTQSQLENEGIYKEPFKQEKVIIDTDPETANFFCLFIFFLLNSRLRENSASIALNSAQFGFLSVVVKKI